MKTTTILSAWDQAAQEAEIYADDMRKLKRAGRIYKGLVRRIEAGDRAREALRMVEYFPFVDGVPDDEVYCPWCHFPKLGKNNPRPHSEICPRQLALGLKP